MDSICANNLFQASVFSKSCNKKCPKNFLQLSFVSSMCQCFIKISFKLDNVCLYVTDTGIHFLSLRFCGRVVVFDQVS